MIKKLKIRNFKSIKNMELNCTDLNLLVGTNSSGKSSVIQGLLFIVQNLDSICGLAGELIELGSFEENKCIYAKEKTMEFSLVDDENREIRMHLYRNEEGKLRLDWNGRNEDMISELKSGLNFRNRYFQYLSCHRVGPRNVYKKNLKMEDMIGINGEYAVAYLNSHGTDALDEKLCRGQLDYTLLGQVNWWLSYIMNTEISTEEISGADLIKASYTMNDIVKVRPANIGAGVSYLISILIVCLSSPEGAVLVIENPEIHLHPLAQAKLCEFFYFIIQSGRQLFVESHSDHIFNGFRAGLATKKMEEDKISIQFLSLNEEHMTEAMKVKVGRMGRIENQRKDLFDQFDIDMNKMIGL